MGHFERLVLTLAIIFVSLAAGYFFKEGCLAGKIPLSEEKLASMRKGMQMGAIYGLIPLSAMFSLWGLPQPEPSLLVLPLLGIVSFIWGGLLALGAAKLLKLNRPQTGSFYCCGTFTNIGAVGSLVCLLFLGENSIALVALYRLFEEVYYFSVAFPIARWYGPANHSQTLSFRSFSLPPIVKIIICALLLGIGLNLAGARRPEMLGSVASGAMLLATICLLFAIGLTLRLSRLLCYIRAGALMSAIKFAGVPLVIVGLASNVDYGGFDNGLALKTVAILSAMPVAMTALIPPSLFDLDLDLANACWIFSTLGLLVVLPALMWVMPML